jgi:hypothetical protein
VVIAGWDDYFPPDPAEIAAGRLTEPLDVKRDYRKESIRRDRATSSASSPSRQSSAASCVGGLFFVALPDREERHRGLGGREPDGAAAPVRVGHRERSALVEHLSAGRRRPTQGRRPIMIATERHAAEIGDQLVEAGVITDARAFVYEAIQKGVTETSRSAGTSSLGR